MTDMRFPNSRGSRRYRSERYPGTYSSASAALSASVSYALSDSCKLVLRKGNITKWFINGRTDAIVNAANERMLGGGGVDGAIHRAAGPALLEACKEVPQVEPDVRCPTGSARITKGFKLPVSNIIHTVGPIYKSHKTIYRTHKNYESHKEPALALENSYKSCLEIANEHCIKHVAFPAISCGLYRYPLAEGSRIALETVKSHADKIEEVHFVLYREDAWEAWLNTANQLFERIN